MGGNTHGSVGNVSDVACGTNTSRVPQGYTPHVVETSIGVDRCMLALLCSAALAQFLMLCWIPLAFQRYTMPLVPFVSLWAAYGVHQLRFFIRIKNLDCNFSQIMRSQQTI
mgnify:CR=1 FL=1